MASKLAGWWMVCGSFNFHQTEERSCLFGRTNGVIWRETDRPQQPGGGGPNLCVNRVQLWEVSLVFGSWMRRWLRAPSRLVRIPLNRNNPAKLQEAPVVFSAATGQRGFAVLPACCPLAAMDADELKEDLLLFAASGYVSSPFTLKSLK